MRTEHIGPDELLVGAKVELVHGLSVEEAVEAVNRIENSVRRAVPTARIMYLEPDIFRTSLPSDEAASPAAGAGGHLTDAHGGADAEAPDAAAAPEVSAAAETRAGGPARSE
jgi:hypothetical protein